MGAWKNLGQFFGFVPPSDSVKLSQDVLFRTGAFAPGDITSNDYRVPTDSGEDVSAGPAMQVSAWQARCNIIVNNCAKLPMCIVDRETGEPVATQPLWCGPRPTRMIDAWGFKQRIFDGFARYGWAALVVDEFDDMGLPQRVYPLPNRFCQLTTATSSGGGTDRVGVVFNSAYRTSKSTGKTYTEWRGAGDPIQSERTELVLMLRYKDDGSLGGANPTHEAAEVLGCALAAQANAAYAFGTGGAGDAILFSDGMDLDDLAAWVDSYKEWRAQPENRHQPAVSNHKFEKIDLRRSVKDQQLLEARRLSAEEIARSANIPPELIGLGQGAYGSQARQLTNILHQMVLEPYLTAVESGLSRLLPDEQRVRFDTTEFLLGSVTEQFHTYEKALISGLLTPNEAREGIGREPIDQEGADELHFNGTTGDQGDRDDGNDERNANAPVRDVERDDEDMDDEDE